MATPPTSPPLTTALPYCPNCRHPLLGIDLGWICWQRRSEQRTPSDTSGLAHLQAGKVFQDQTTVQPQLYVQVEDIICDTFNPPAAPACRHSECGRERGPANTFRPACPRCQMEIPRVENVRDSTITITGPAGAGKSHFIVALSDWWEMNLGFFNLTVEPAMGSRLRAEFDRQYEQVVNSGQKLPTSIPGHMVSFSWIIRPGANIGSFPGMLCTLPDVSGERLYDEKALESNRHYHYSKGIILILDGDRIAVAQQLVRAEALPQERRRSPRDQTLLIDAMIANLRTLKPNDYVDIPIAVCVNKVDALSEMDQSGHWKNVMLLNTPTHVEQGGFHLSACQARSGSIETLLLSHRQTAPIVHKLRSNFAQIMFFGIATIGSDADHGGKIRYDPVSVEDPFLWLVQQLRPFAV